MQKILYRAGSRFDHHKQQRGTSEGNHRIRRRGKRKEKERKNFFKEISASTSVKLVPHANVIKPFILFIVGHESKIN